MAKLTKRVVDAAQAPKLGQSFLWDGELRGFGVRVMQSGLKTFILQYRNAEGRSRRMVLGRYGVLTVEQARDQARIRLGLVAGGSDPAQDKQELRAAPTVSDICNWYLEEAEAGRLIGRRRRPIKESTVRMERSRIERHIKPILGHRQIRGLKLHDIETMQAEIAAGKTRAAKGAGRGRKTTGGVGAASRCASTLHSVFGHAKRLGKIETNPASGIRRLAGTPRDRRLSATEIVALGQAMRDSVALGEHPVGLSAVRFIALTGFRLNEAQKLDRRWIEHTPPCVRFPDTKSGAQVRAIGSAAANVLGSQPEMSECPFVFPSDDGSSHYKQVPDLLARLCHIARIEGVTAHTLRHTFGSIAGDLGFSELTIAALLGHGKRGVTQGYIHIDDALKVAVERVSEKVADLLDGRTATVYSMDRAAA